MLPTLSEVSVLRRSTFVLGLAKRHENAVSSLSRRHPGDTTAPERSVHFAPVSSVFASSIRRFALGERAQSLIETALVLPLIIYGLLGGVDIARGYAIQLAVQNGARAGAEAAALERMPTPIEAIAHAQQEMNRTPGMNADNATITVTFTLADSTTPCPGAANTSIAGTSTYAIPCFANVRVRYTFSTITPWPGMPHTFMLDRSTSYRRYQ